MAKVRGKKQSYRVSSQIHGLALLADAFNRLDKGVRAREVPTEQFLEARSIVDQFLKGPEEAEAATIIFNELAIKYLQPIASSFELENGSLCTNALVTTNRASNPKIGLVYLWNYFFAGNGWNRLKKCAGCGIWFVDKTKPHSKKYCSEPCKLSWWTVDRRKAAGHKMLRPIKPGKKSKTRQPQLEID